MKILYFILFCLSCLISCLPVETESTNIFVDSLDDCKTHADSVFVIDNKYRNENGNIKPPCSCSPEYNECMKNRIKELELDNFNF